MKRKNQRTDFRDYNRHLGMPEEDRLEAIDIVSKHFPDIPVHQVYRLTVNHEEGYAIITVYQYARVSATDPKRFIDAATGEVAVLAPVTKSFPSSGLL